MPHSQARPRPSLLSDGPDPLTSKEPDVSPLSTGKPFDRRQDRRQLVFPRRDKVWFAIQPPRGITVLARSIVHRVGRQSLAGSEQVAQDSTSLASNWMSLSPPLLLDSVSCHPSDLGRRLSSNLRWFMP